MARKYQRRQKKPSMAKAKKMVTKNNKKKAKKNMDTYFLKTKNLFNAVPVQGTTVSNYVYTVHNLDPTGTQAPYLSNAEFNLWKLQYDKFRVNSVTVRVKPKANVLDQATAQNDTTLNVVGDGLVHTCVDRDSAAPSSTALISRYPSYKSYSVLKPFTRSYSVKYPTGVWIDCDSPAAFTMAKELGLGGGITMYAESLLEDNSEIFNEPWAEITVEYNIVFQGKTSNSLRAIRDENGDLIGVGVIKVPTAELLALSPLVNVRGSLEDDTRTQNEITEDTITDVGTLIVQSMEPIG